MECSECLLATRYNIAVCLAPTILCDRTSESTGVSALVEMPRVLKIVEFLIVHLDEIVSQLKGLEKTVDDAEMQAALQNLKVAKGPAAASSANKKPTAAPSQQSSLGRASSKVGNVLLCVHAHTSPFLPRNGSVRLMRPCLAFFVQVAWDAIAPNIDLEGEEDSDDEPMDFS